MTGTAKAPWKQDVIEAEVVPDFEAAPASTESALVPVDDLESAVQSTDSRSYSTKPKLDLEDMFMPKLRLCQGQTPEVVSGEAKAGQWILQGNEPSDEVEVVVLAMGRAREYWKGEDRDNRELSCKSKDGELGEGDPGGPCDLCPLSQWSTHPRTQKRIMPLCDMIYSYQVYIPEWATMALLEMRRTGLTPGRQINTMIGSRGMANFTIKLSGEKRQNGSILYYIPRVVARPISAELKEEALMWAPRT